MSRSLCMGSINKEHAHLLQQLTQRIGWNLTSQQVNMFLSVQGLGLDIGWKMNSYPALHCFNTGRNSLR